MQLQDREDFDVIGLCKQVQRPTSCGSACGGVSQSMCSAICCVAIGERPLREAKEIYVILWRIQVNHHNKR